MELKSLPVDQAVIELTKFLRVDAIAKEMGTSYLMVSRCKNHPVVNGKPFYLSSERTEDMRKAVQTIGTELLNTRIDPSMSVAVQLRDLAQTVNLTRLTLDLVGKGKQWLFFHTKEGSGFVSKGRWYSYYDQFTEEEIKAFNNAIRTVALQVLSIEILDQPAPIDEEEMLLANTLSSDEAYEDELALL